MKRAEKKKRARKFNVCKKICQLNRVATLFSIQYQEQAFQRQYLSDFYSAKIAAILDDAWNKSESCHNEINSIYPQIKTKYRQIFGKKYKEIQIDINVFIKSTGEMIERRLKNISMQIEYKTNEIRSINEKINKYHNPNYENEIFDGFVNNLNSLVQIQKQRYNAAKSQIYITLNSKASILKNESEMRLHKMNTERDFQRGLIKSQYPKNPEIEELYRSFLHNFLLPYQQRFEHAQLSFQSVEDKFISIKNSSEKSFSNTKSQILKEIDKIKHLKKKFNTEKKEITHIIDHTAPDDTNNDSIELIKKEMMNKINSFKKEEDELKNQLFENHQKFENTIQFLELNHQGRLSNFDTIFVELQANQVKEINDKKLKNGQIEKIANDRIKQILNEIDEFTNSHKEIKQTLTKQLKEIQSENSKIIDEISYEFECEKENLIQKFQKEKNEFHQKNSKLTCDLKNLENEKLACLSRFEDFAAIIEKDDQKEIENLANNFKFSISELRTEITNKLDKLSQLSSEEIKNCQIECLKKKNDKLKQYEFMYNQEILKVQFNFENTLNFNQNYLKDVNNHYSNIFNECQAMLKKVEPPSFNDNYARLTAELSTLNKKKNDTIEIIESERKKLNQFYQSRIEREQKRHQMKMMEQEEMIEIHCEKEKKLNELTSLQIKDDRLDSIDFNERAELIELHYMREKDLLIKKINQIQLEINSKKEALKKSIDDLKKSFEIQIKPYQLKYNAIIKKQRAILSHSPNSNVPFDELFHKKMRNHKEKVKKLRDAIHDAKTAQKLNENEHEHLMFINMQKYKKNFQINENKMKDEVDQLIKKRDLLKSELKSESEVGDVKQKLSVNDSKSLTQEKIVRLTARLNKVNHQLTSILAEYKKYKSLFGSQENRMRSSYGANQAVAVLQLSPTVS